MLLVCLVILLPVTLACPACAGAFDNPIRGFGPPANGMTIVNSTILSRVIRKSKQSCGAECLGNPKCIAFTWNPDSGECVTSSWSNWYAIEPASSQSIVTYTRIRHLSKERVVPKLEMALTVPTSGVRLEQGGLLKSAFDSNVGYLMQFPVGDLLFWFRKRKGLATRGGSSWGWDRFAASFVRRI